MRRSPWTGAVLAALTSAGLAWAQAPAGNAPRPAGEKIVNIQEVEGKRLSCRLLQAWELQGGRKAYQVQDTATGEMLTIVETVPGGSGAPTPTRIYHWGVGNLTPPTGAPLAPNAAPTPGDGPHLSEAAPVRPTSAEAPPRSTSGLKPVAAPSANSTPRVVTPGRTPPAKAQETMSLFRPTSTKSAVPAVQSTAPVVPSPAPAVEALPPRIIQTTYESSTIGVARSGHFHKDDGCGLVHCAEAIPQIKYKSAGCVPICPPYNSPFFGYYPTLWRPWPGMPGPAPVYTSPAPEAVPIPTTTTAPTTPSTPMPDPYPMMPRATPSKLPPNLDDPGR